MGPNLRGFDAAFVWFYHFVKEQRFFGAPYVTWLFRNDVVRCPGMPLASDPKSPANDNRLFHPMPR